MEEDNRCTRFRHAVNRYLWDVRRGVALKKTSFYRELSPLERVYTTRDCTLFSYGSVAGVGTNIVLMSCIFNYGSLVVFSVMISVIATLITCMCYAELASLAPSTGAVYHYCYHTIGELVGFLVGWNMILAYWFSCSFTIRTLGLFMDHNLFENAIRCKISSFFSNFKPIENIFFNITNNVVLLSLIFSLLLSGLCSFKTKSSKRINNWIVIVTIVFTCFCLILYLMHLNLGNIIVIPKDINQFEFFICTSAHIAFCFSGYEVISCMGEEAINPSETIPTSILRSIKILSIIVLIQTFLHSSVYFGENQEYLSPMSFVLVKLGLYPLNWAAIVAGLTGMGASAYATMFVVIRVMYAMSRDGLLPKIFSKIDRRTKVPVVSAFISGFTIGVFGTFLDTDTLAGISEIGIIFSQMMVAICLLITRYRCEDRGLNVSEDPPRWVLVNYPRKRTPDKITQRISELLILNLVLTIICLNIVPRSSSLFARTPYVDKTIFLLVFTIFIFLIICLNRQPQNSRLNIYYTVRGVPSIPILVIMYNVFTITNIGLAPWASFFCWTVVGILFYFVYSVTHSDENCRLLPDGRLWRSMRSSIFIQTPSVDVVSSSTAVVKKKEQKLKNLKNKLNEDAKERKGKREKSPTVSFSKNDSKDLTK